MSRARGRVEVLFIEDDLGDVELMVSALKRGEISVNLSVVRDGEEGLAYLKNKEPYPHVKRPELIILDLNLPRMDGREVLKAVKRDESLKSIPIVVLTTSDSESDIKEAYRLGANCFVTKPVELREFTKVASVIESFWCEIVKLPKSA
jgi:two-component system, chemotaxis family, response regulator Rcp1